MAIQLSFSVYISKKSGAKVHNIFQTISFRTCFYCYFSSDTERPLFLVLLPEVEDTLMAGSAVTGVARHTERGGGVALLPAPNHVRLTDERARQTGVDDFGLVEILVDFL